MLFLLTILLTANMWVFPHQAILTLTTQNEYRAHSCRLRAQSQKTAFLFRWQLNQGAEFPMGRAGRSRESEKGWSGLGQERVAAPWL